MKLVPPLLVLALLLPSLAARAEEDREHYLRDVVIEANQSVEDAICLFCSVVARGTVKSDVVVIGGGVSVKGVVEGDVVILGGGLRLAPRARVGGDAVVWGGPVEIPATAQVGDSVDSNPYFHLPGQRQLFWRGLLALGAANLVIVLLPSLLLRRRLEGLSDALHKRPWRSLLVGAGGLAAFVFLLNLCDSAGDYEDAAALAVTGLFLVVFLPGYAGLTVAVGRWMAGARSLPKALLMGVLRTTVLLAFPLFGFVSLMLLAALALGATALGRFGFSTPARPA